MKRHCYSVQFSYFKNGSLIFSKVVSISVSDRALILNTRDIKRALHGSIWVDASKRLRCNGNIQVVPICYLGKMEAGHTPIKTFLERHFGGVFNTYVIQKIATCDHR